MRSFSSFFLAGLQLNPTTNRAAIKIVPSRTALFLLDLQVIYAKMDPSFDALMTHTACVVKAARSKGITIAHWPRCLHRVRDCKCPRHEPDFLPTKARSLSCSYVQRKLVRATFHPAVAPEDGDIVVRKNRVGPFFNAPQDVHAIFKGRGIGTLLLGGVSTGGAVAAAVVQASDLDYRLFVVEDSCADPNKETHESLMKFFAKRATVIRSEELKTVVK